VSATETTPPTAIPAEPAAPKQKNGVGLAALIVGIVAFFFAVIPVLSFIAWLPALVAIGLGIAGLAVKNKKRAQALIGLLLGVLAMIVGLIVSLTAVVGVASSISDSIKTAAPGAAASQAPAAQASQAAPAKGASAADWAAKTYGSFAPVTKQGTGDSVVALPANVKAALVTASYDGSQNFSVQVIDAKNQPTLDLLVNTIGAYKGTTAYGLNGTLGGAGTNLKVSGAGNWTITIAPLSSASEQAPSGTGDGVFLHSGGAANAAFTNNGKGNFAVQEYTGEAFQIGLLVNQIGAYNGTVPISAGPSVITIKSDGNWTAAIG
jgi:hypothetical protein